VLIFTTSARPRIARATFSSSGATMRHGPHHGAQKSMTTGTLALDRSASNVRSSSIDTGESAAASGLLQAPHRSG
jgi:hypothetical protein